MSATRPPSIGLVLGAGGIPGFAYTVGALAALAEISGWDPRHADVIVGTSAGSGVATLLRAGLSAADHLLRLQGETPSSEGRDLLARLPQGAPSEEPPESSTRPASPRGSLRGLLNWPPRPGLSVAGALPAGRHSTGLIQSRYAAALPRWPADPLWICAVHLDDGRRVIFGRDDHVDVDVGTAVAASSAVPGFFAPVEIDGERYVDGAVWSSTNADLLVGVGYDVVVAVAPLSAATTALRLDLSSVNRLYHRKVFASEVARIERAGTPVIVVEPTAADLQVWDRQGGDGPRGDLATQARGSTLDQLGAAPARLAGLTSAVAA